jgi:hypothetical protein
LRPQTRVDLRKRGGIFGQALALAVSKRFVSSFGRPVTSDAGKVVLFTS